MLAGALDNFYGNYEVRAKKVKTKGREEMFSFGFPTKSEDTKREKSKSKSLVCKYLEMSLTRERKHTSRKHREFQTASTQKGLHQDML